MRGWLLVGCLLCGAVVGCGESAEQRYARALQVYNTELELADRMRALIKEHEADGDIKGADEVRDALKKQYERADVARSLLEEAEKGRSIKGE